MTAIRHRLAKDDPNCAIIHLTFRLFFLLCTCLQTKRSCRKTTDPKYNVQKPTAKEVFGLILRAVFVVCFSCFCAGYYCVFILQQSLFYKLRLRKIFATFFLSGFLYYLTLIFQLFLCHSCKFVVFSLLLTQLQIPSQFSARWFPVPSRGNFTAQLKHSGIVKDAVQRAQQSGVFLKILTPESRVLVADVILKLPSLLQHRSIRSKNSRVFSVSKAQWSISSIIRRVGHTKPLRPESVFPERLAAANRSRSSDALVTVST